MYGLDQTGADKAWVFENKELTKSKWRSLKKLITVLALLSCCSIISAEAKTVENTSNTEIIKKTIAFEGFNIKARCITKDRKGNIYIAGQFGANYGIFMKMNQEGQSCISSRKMSIF